MIGEKSKFVGFKEEMEMADQGVSIEEFSVEGRILGFGRR